MSASVRYPPADGRLFRRPILHDSWPRHIGRVSPGSLLMGGGVKNVRGYPIEDKY